MRSRLYSSIFLEMPIRRKKEKEPPILSHECFIQNHGDIFASFCLLVFAGSLSEWTPNLSNPLLYLNYAKNVTNDEGEILRTDY